jgi:PiT family inorganic phosphate transporter
VSGAVIAGSEVTKTIRKGIVDLSQMYVEPIQFVCIMMSAPLAAALWLLFATKRGYPVSTTHSIIGGIVGSSIALVHWNEIGTIVLSWVVSPMPSARSRLYWMGCAPARSAPKRPFPPWQWSPSALG